MDDTYLIISLFNHFICKDNLLSNKRKTGSKIHPIKVKQPPKRLILLIKHIFLPNNADKLKTIRIFAYRMITNNTNRYGEN